MDLNLDAVTQWLSFLPAVSNGTAEVLQAYETIKAAAQAGGVAKDTAQLDAVVLNSAARKAREDALLAGGGE